MAYTSGLGSSATWLYGSRGVRYRSGPAIASPGLAMATALLGGSNLCNSWIEPPILVMKAQNADMQ